MSNQAKRAWAALPLVFMLLFSGCTKEKAEALKLAAEQFQIQASAAISAIRGLIKQSTIAPSPDLSKMETTVFNKLMSQDVVSNDLTFLMQQISGETASEQPDAPTAEAFKEVEKPYIEFAEMYQSLPQGSYLAKDAVKKSAKAAAKLTLQLINFAQVAKERPVRFNSRRTLLVERLNAARTVKDPAAQHQLILGVIKDAAVLRQEELSARDALVAQCLQAAECGRNVMDLIQHYDKFSVKEVLALIQTSLSAADSISGKRQDVDSLFQRYTKVKTTIEEDPYWKPLLEKEL